MFPTVEALVSILFTWISAKQTLSPNCEELGVICKGGTMLIYCTDKHRELLHKH